MELTGVKSFRRSFLPVAGQMVAASGLSTIALLSGASDGSQNDFSACASGFRVYHRASEYSGQQWQPQ